MLRVARKMRHREKGHTPRHPITIAGLDELLEPHEHLQALFARKIWTPSERVLHVAGFALRICLLISHRTGSGPGPLHPCPSKSTPLGCSNSLVIKEMLCCPPELYGRRPPSTGATDFPNRANRDTL